MKSVTEKLTNDNKMQTILDEFDTLGRSASFHFADDTGREWHQGNMDKASAMALYRAHPEGREQMKVIAKEFLWSLGLELAK